jgi:hypothetical protein
VLDQSIEGLAGFTQLLGHQMLAIDATMTNGAVGQTVSSVDGPVLTVKYRDGEKKIIVVM